MIKATIKATGEQQYFFESKSNPGHYHKVTHNAQHGCYECNCLGFTGKYHKCWHVAQVAKLATAELKAQRQPVVQQPVATVDLAAWDRFYAEQHERNEAAMLETAAAQVARQPGVLAMVAAGIAQAKIKAANEARWDAYQNARLSGGLR